ncbi:MAG: AAA family ATPase [Phaeodactylibacter sp.]|nr:AAA family ATPase [Phaeodactylibacter sp.]
MKKYPIGIQDFQKLREGGFLYVDKTEAVFNLIKQGQYYFLSRPRRFGKSLLLSTLKYLFLGEQELFEGLWVDGKYDFPPHPVLHFSFSTLGYKEIGLEAGLHQALDNKAREAGFVLTQKGLGPRFQELIQRLGKDDRKAVLLIDEYDKPLVDYIDNPEKAQENREILKGFFSVLKDADPYLRFFLITGVSKFSKVSLFSDLNNLEDITLAPSSTTLTGYTQAELEHHFEEPFREMAKAEELDYSALLEKVRLWYNGYQWYGPERLYNPFSILNLAKQQRFANFWWETGTPSFLIKHLKKGFHYDLESVEIGSDVFESYTLENLNWKSLLFQTGYLTIQTYHKEDRLYTLGYPNLEVKDAMHRHLLGAFRESDKSES